MWPSLTKLVSKSSNFDQIGAGSWPNSAKSWPELGIPRCGRKMRAEGCLHNVVYVAMKQAVAEVTFDMSAAWQRERSQAMLHHDRCHVPQRPTCIEMWRAQGVSQAIGDEACSGQASLECRGMPLAPTATRRRGAALVDSLDWPKASSPSVRGEHAGSTLHTAR